MSAFPTDVRLDEADVPEPSHEAGSGSTGKAYRDLPIRAKLFLFATAAIAVGIVVPLISRISHGDSRRDWTTFFVLGSLAALSQLFVVFTPRGDHSYHTSIVYLIPAAMLLPPELVVLIATVQHVPDWLKYRYRWYVQTFNICSFTLASMATWGVAHVIRGSQLLNPDLRLAMEIGRASCRERVFAVV